MAVQTCRQVLPPIRVTETDYEALAELAEAMRGDGAALLRQELERARIVRRTRSPFVRLGSTLEYRELITGRGGRVKLCLPRDADIDAGRLSAATPMGAALIGLRARDVFTWTGADGRAHAVIVDWLSDDATYTVAGEEAA